MSSRLLLGNRMASYAQLTLRFDRALSPDEVLEPIFASEWLTPIAIGGVEMAHGGDHWFLAGYALEDFMAVLAGRRTHAPASIETFAGAEPEQVAYLRRRAADLGAEPPVLEPHSPFEQVDAEFGITRVDSRNLDRAVLIDLARWAQEHAGAHVYLYGCVHIATSEQPQGGRMRAFRLVHPGGQRDLVLGVPFLVIRFAPSLDGNSSLALRMAVPIWCSEAKALGGRIDARASDENLRRLSVLAESLASVTPRRPTAELHLEGKAFLREEVRFEKAFRGVLGA